MVEVRHWYGFFLSLTTAFMWGVLPVFLTLLLEDMDAISITWARFTVSAVLVFLFLRSRAGLLAYHRLGLRTLLILLIATCALIGNFLLYLKSLNYLNPESAQVMIQLAPFILMFGSVYFYQEKFGRPEILGSALLLFGLGLFFNNRIDEIFNSFGEYTLGIVIMLCAAISWGIYGLLQKHLLSMMNSRQLTLFIYCGGAVGLTLFVTFSSFTGLSLLQYAALLFCCLNMVIGYGTFTEALHYWQAAKVSAVIALAPLITILSMALAVRLWPQYFSDSELNLVAYAGAIMVVAGSMLGSLGRRPA
ncbi:MAG: DMT family transporter [Pseudohongiellaceae bacterium]